MQPARGSATMGASRLYGGDPISGGSPQIAAWETMKKAVFIDRDGTIIFDRVYLTDPEQVELVPAAGASLRRMIDAGYILVLITNQSLIGRGMGTSAQVDAVHARMAQLLARDGVRFAGMYYCPHTPEDQCGCRKAEPGLLLEATEALDIELDASVMIGDNASDVEAGLAAGCPLNILIGEWDDREGAVVVPTLQAAADVVVARAEAEAAHRETVFEHEKEIVQSTWGRVPGYIKRVLAMWVGVLLGALAFTTVFGFLAPGSTVPAGAWVAFGVLGIVMMVTGWIRGSK